MGLSESMVAEQIDEILRRSLLRVNRQRTHLAKLVGPEAIVAERTLAQTLAAVGRLTAYRAKFAAA
jgi:hypothetical protein